MTRIHKTSIAVLLVVAALGLGACGGDDEGSSGSGDTGASATETTGTTKTTGTTRTDTTETRERTGKTTTSERKRDDKGGSGGNSGSGGGSDDSSGSGSGGGSKQKSSNTQLTDKNVKSTAKTVCASFLPTQLEKDLKSGKKSAEEIAKDYSQAFPSEQRKSAHDGCLAGLKTKD